MTYERLKILAEALRAAASNVIHEMKATPGGDGYEYQGSAGAVDALQDALSDYEGEVKP